MSGYGFPDCKLCGAHTDYCSFQGATGVEVDCRNIADLLTDEQAAMVKELMCPDWWLEMRAGQV